MGVETVICARITVSEMKTYLADSPFEDFANWLLGAGKGLSGGVFTHIDDGNGTLDARELTEAVELFFEQSRGGGQWGSAMRSQYNAHSLSQGPTMGSDPRFNHRVKPGFLRFHRPP